MTERTGAGWARELGSKLVGRRLTCTFAASTSRNFLVEGTTYVVTDNLKVQDVNLPNLTASKFKLEEETVMLDKAKPLVITGLPGRGEVPVVYIGVGQQGYWIVQEKGAHNLFEVYPEAGFVYGSIGYIRCVNKLEPWEAAFKQYCLEEVDQTEEDIFRRAFELGVEWTSKQKQ